MQGHQARGCHVRHLLEKQNGLLKQTALHYPFIYHVHQIFRRIQLPVLVPDEALALA